MAESTILVEDRAAGSARYRVITLNRPERLNAFIAPMHQALRRALIEAERDASCRAVLLTGAGRGFCAGQDLSERAVNDGGPPPDLGATLDALYNPLIRRLRAMPLPVVCAVNGPAAGAGANIALAGDIVLAARSATFLQAFARIGLSPDAGGTFFLTRTVGPARARALAMLAEPLGAEQAADWGLIWKAVDDAMLMDEAHAICAKLASGSAAALAAIKRGIETAATNSLTDQLDLERDAQRELGRSGDYREGVRAFLEKRPAVFGPRR
ncbi:MAG TPA: 2-(1,2-epoxy-1,2-dihydrophenyl)acetyl-CoA isomerase PaaG [Roseiarcus sp.]|nr:2-(1,2-epoxy-1,2-dihydrophenyl)acetyl-CoA isomerase PaaG [Roseiarcus sp.]